MKKSIIISLFFCLILSCSGNKSDNQLRLENENLKTLNDSLRTIIEEINDKYVLDHLTVREIRNDSNTYKLNSQFRTKYYIVGYNNNDLTTFIVADSVNQNFQTDSDTLRLVNGGFEYSKILTEEENEIEINLNVENKYGKKLQAILNDRIRIKN